jgi:hypothetical protein
MGLPTAQQVLRSATMADAFAASFRVSLIFATEEQRAQCVALTGSYTHS